MSFKNLGNKQTIVLHNCEIDNQKIRSCNNPTYANSWIHSNKKTNKKRKIISKQRQVTRKRFSKKKKRIFGIRSQQFKRTTQIKRINK